MAHFVPHAPQLRGSDLVLVQTPLQRTWLPAHWQTPETQVWIVVQVLPHLPQLLWSP